MTQGDIYWYEDENTARRPFLVLTRSAAIAVLDRVVAAPLTTVIRDIATEVLLTTHDGVPRDCVVSADNIRLIERRRLSDRITTLTPARMREVCEAISFAIDC